MDNQQGTELHKLAFAFGFFLSDGHLSAGNRVGFTKQDIDVLQIVKTDIESVFLKEGSLGVYHYPPRSSIGKLAFTSPQIFDFFASNSYMKTRVPEEVFSLPPEGQDAFLQGILDGDCSVSQNGGRVRIEFCSTNRHFTETVAHLLSKRGVTVGNISEGERGFKRYYRVVPNVKSFLDKGISFRGARKQSKLLSAD